MGRVESGLVASAVADSRWRAGRIFGRVTAGVLMA
jgi:hypothetical protein